MPTPTGHSIPNNILQRTAFNTAPLLPSYRIRTADQVELDQLEPIDQIPRNIEFQNTLSTQKFDEEGAADCIPEVRSRVPQGSVSAAGLSEETQQLLSDRPSSLEYNSDDSQMQRNPQKPHVQNPDRPSSTGSGGLNGHTNGHANGNMNSQTDMRRKNPSFDSPTAASQTAHLMSRESFTLDDEPPPTPVVSNPNASFFDLPRQERSNFLLLVLLYFLQGIPMGLAAGSVPFLLKSHLSYGQIGVFTLASYPYSLKLLWSPIVDAVWSPALGRRKSWIMPIQMFSGFGMIYLGSRIKDMMIAAGASDGSGVWTFTCWWFFLVFLCATQDIAVDGVSQ